MTTTPVDVERLRALCEAATPGPWHAADAIRPTVFLYATPSPRPGRDWRDEALMLGQVYADGNGQGRRNLAFIAAARTAVPALVDENERLKRELQEARGVAANDSEHWQRDQRRIDTVTAERDAARAELAKMHSDWDALVKLIAQSIGTDEDQEAADLDELEEFDPWHALRHVQGRWNAMVSERNIATAECERLRSTIAKSRELSEILTATVRSDIERQTAERIAAWLDEQVELYRQDWERRSNVDAIRASARAAHDAVGRIAADIRAGAWRTP